MKLEQLNARIDAAVAKLKEELAAELSEGRIAPDQDGYAEFCTLFVPVDTSAAMKEVIRHAYRFGLKTRAWKRENVWWGKQNP